MRVQAVRVRCHGRASAENFAMLSSSVQSLHTSGIVTDVFYKFRRPYGCLAIAGSFVQAQAYIPRGSMYPISRYLGFG